MQPERNKNWVWTVQLEYVDVSGYEIERHNITYLLKFSSVTAKLFTKQHIRKMFTLYWKDVTQTENLYKSWTRWEKE